MSDENPETQAKSRESRAEVQQRLQRGHRDLGSILLEDERVLLEAEIHWGIFWKGVVFLIFSLFLLLFTPAYNLGVIFTALAVVVLIFEALTKYYLALVMTDRRVLARWGILNLDFVDMRFKQIESAQTFRSIMGRILGYGSVVLAGTGQRVVAVPYIANAGQFRLELNEILLKREHKVD